MDKLVLLPVIAALLFLASCKDDAASGKWTAAPASPSDSLSFTAWLETAHRKPLALEAGTVQFDIALSGPETPALSARILQRTDGSALAIRYANGTRAGFDGRQAWIARASGDMTSDRQARYDLYTWHHLFCLPWRLQDPGCRLSALPEREFGGRLCRCARLSFAPGTGDSPDDWYVLFADRSTGLLFSALFISTYGNIAPEKAAKTPQAVLFEDYQPAGDIPVARRWVFRGWHTDQLDTGRALGTALIGNVVFGPETPGMFAGGDNAAPLGK